MMHIDELAELYALGSLDEEEVRRVNDHVATCEACRKRVTDAEQVVTAMALDQSKSEMPRRPARKPLTVQLWPALGFAAGLILPLLFLLPIVLHERQSAQETHLAFASLVNSHFSHVAFTRRTADAPNAKLLYARTGSWLYVVVLQPNSDLDVLLRGQHSVRHVGTIHGNRADAEVFVQNPGPVDQVLLVRSGAIVADAHPAFTSESRPPAATPAARR
ncbi:MAG: zf-HC2 domain-containing protein [Candidatus Eremiobacteraeota bacterium]|nr:zf-HC2 domain-containing protein [Candidatus Eremiobacteraeota bacterium]